MNGPTFTVFTPSHDPRYLDDCVTSLLRQTRADWEWVVLLNDGVQWRPERADDRIRIEQTAERLGVGAAKAAACGYARGDVLVELDHDDMLLPEALERAAAAFDARPEASLVYSHAAQIRADGSPDDARYRDGIGWEYRETVVDGRRMSHAVTFEPTPHNVGYIWFAPNHLRAFRRSAYEAVGGYDPTKDVLDDQDLLSRLYQWGPFVRIDECLYLQRMHQRNTQRDVELNARIQVETIGLYDLYFESLALSWARREGLDCLDLGAAHNRPPGYRGVDQHPGPDVDIVATLPDRLPLADGSAGVIRAVDFLEHVADKVATIRELHRVLAPGGVLISRTPSTDGRGAYQDPTHVAFYNENSFWYYTDAEYARFVPELGVRFQASRLATVFPSEWHREHDIPYVYANLIKLGDGLPRNGGAIAI
jgi:glycosyltransferase involved in cell wall biosynthesis